MAAVSSDPNWTSPAAIEAWFNEPHQKHFARPYDAAHIARLRDPVNMSTTNNATSLKMRALFKKNHETKKSSVALGTGDYITAHVAAEVGMEVLYVSGAGSSHTDTTTMDVGPDLADYPYDTVPKKVKQIVRGQLLHTRVDQVRKHNGTLTKTVDRMTPIIADGDSGHGATTAIMKLTKAFVEAGVSGFHIDDLFSGVKEFSSKKLLDHVIVPVSEHIRRLLAAKLQLDMMGAETVLIHRTDAETSCWLTSTIDARDRPFILGSTNPTLGPFVRSTKAGQSENDWLAAAKLSTIDAAVKAAVSAEAFAKFEKETEGLNVAEAFQYVLKEKLDVFWDYEAPRSPEGWYRFDGGIDSAISRSIHCANYADMVWTMTGSYQPDRRLKYSQEIQKALPGKLMVYNWSGPYLTQKPTDEELSRYHKETAELGYSFQMMPLAGPKGAGTSYQQYAADVYNKGMLGYNDWIKKGTEINCDVLGWHLQTGELGDAMTNSVKI
ncbi:isocitrate lyase [Pseudohyphozyma bogoriensis]|nr:isocitrate lyase [Pseudohyphozyma bogoriensis]